MKTTTLLITSALLMNELHAISVQASNGAPLPAVPVAAVPLKGRYVTLPTTPDSHVEYYAGMETYPYVYYGGYFWYPKTEATVLTEYTPTYWNGYYWYASRVHPHQVYVEKQDALYLVPMEPTGILE